MKQSPADFLAPVVRRTCLIFLTAALTIVHSPAGGGRAQAEDRSPVLQTPAAAPAKAPEVLRDVAALPAPVQKMRLEILRAAATGQIESLRQPIELNELRPTFASKAVGDPIAFLRAASGDGEGREILAILIDILTTACVRQKTAGGGESYVWPYFAETPLDRLTPAQQVELLRLAPVARFKEMRETGRYDDYRLVIGHDGVWHAFRKDR